MNKIGLRYFGLGVLAFLLPSLGWWMIAPQDLHKANFEHAVPYLFNEVVERTLHESRFGSEMAASQSPPRSQLAPEIPSTPQENGEVSLPEGYVLGAHVSVMQRASFTDHEEIEPASNPEWLEQSVGIKAILQHPLAPGRDRIFAVVRLVSSVPTAATRQAVTDLGAGIEGTSGEFLRVLVEPRRELLRSIVELPGVLGLGMLPRARKFDPHFAQSLLATSASQHRVVFITLMGEDWSGQWRQALTGLGVTVGAYDSDLRTYTATLPPTALEDVAAADYVMRIDPVIRVTAAHAQSVPVMGADAMRTYSFATESFSGIAGRGMAVGVLDTGLNVRHSDIGQGRASICGANFIEGEEADLWNDAGEHGTHVFGTIAGAGRVDPFRAGIAPNLSHLRFGKVLRAEGWGSTDEIRRGMSYLSRASGCDGPAGENAPVLPMIVNMSLASSGRESSGRAIEERKLDSVVYATGQLYVVAQSNEGEFGFSNFASAKNSLSVGAVDDSGRIAHFSSHGPSADGRLLPKVVGTGVDLWSVKGSGSRTDYESASGTSMASPSVAGVAALLMEADSNFRGKSALTRARLMASAIRADAYFEGGELFPLDNSHGPGSLQNQYGMGLVSTRASIASLDSEQGWSLGSAESSPENGVYEYVDIEVPEGADRLDLVMTWDEVAADGLTNSVVNDLDLFVDEGADCGTGGCGEYASRSRIDNVEWIIIQHPKPGVHRIKVTPVQVYNEAVTAAVAWKLIRGESTPQLSISLEETPLRGNLKRLRLGVHTSGYLSSGTTLHFSCRDDPGQDCEGLNASLRRANSKIVRRDGLSRTLSPGLGQAYSIGEVAPDAPRRLELELNAALPEGTLLYATASSMNALSASRAIFADPDAVGESDVHTPANDAFVGSREISGDSGEIRLSLAMASREPGEPHSHGNTRSLWYIWEAPESKIYRISFADGASGEQESVQLDIYTGDSLNSLTRVASRNGSEASFRAHIGTSYRMRVSTRSGILPEVRMRWETADIRPENDQLVNATRLQGATGTISASTQGATLERGEDWNGPTASVWYTWTAPQDGVMSMLSFSADSRLMAFVGDSIESLRLLSAPRLDNIIGFPVSEGREYKIAVVANDTESANVNSEITWGVMNLDSLAGQDVFDRAALLEGGEGLIDSPYEDGLTAEIDEPRESGIGTRWWRWQAPRSGNQIFAMDAGHDFQLSLFNGESLLELSLLGVGRGRTPVVLNAQANQTYMIAMGRSMDSFNIGRVLDHAPRWLKFGPQPDNDDRIRAQRAAGARGSATFNISHASQGSGDPGDDVGRESLWWRWNAPGSGWQTFSVEDDPDWAIVSVYPAEQTLAHDSLASSERSYLAGGRVEAVFLARGGQQYDVRVAKRPGPEVSDTARLNWNSTEAPAYLAHLGSYKTYRPFATGLDASIENPHNLAMHEDGEWLFSTGQWSLAVFRRDVGDGRLTLVETVEAASAGFLSLLSWNTRVNRLFTFHHHYAGAISLPPGSTSGWSLSNVTFASSVLRSDSEGGQSLVKSLDDRFLYVADPDIAHIDVYEVESPSAVTHVQSLIGGTPENDKETEIEGLSGIGQMLVTPDSSHLFAAAKSGLFVFAIDPASGRLELARHLAVASLSETPFAGMRELGGVSLHDGRKILFVSATEAPEVAVFDVSEVYSNLRHLDSLTDFFHEGRHILTSENLPRADIFEGCGRAYSHGSATAIDVVCRNGHFIVLWDENESSLRVTDYGHSSFRDRFGNALPAPAKVYGNRQAAQSPDGKFLYRTTGLTEGIHIFQRASAMRAEEGDNHAPNVRRRLKDQVTFVGEAFSYQVPADTFVDPDGDTLTYSASGQPAWLAFNPATFSFSGTPAAEDTTLAPLVIVVTANDDENASASVRFGLEVRPKDGEGRGDEMMSGRGAGTR